MFATTAKKIPIVFICALLFGQQVLAHQVYNFHAGDCSKVLNYVGKSLERRNLLENNTILDQVLGNILIATPVADSPGSFKFMFNRSDHIIKPVREAVEKYAKTLSPVAETTSEAKENVFIGFLGYIETGQFRPYHLIDLLNQASKKQDEAQELVAIFLAELLVTAQIASSRSNQTIYGKFLAELVKHLKRTSIDDLKKGSELHQTFGRTLDKIDRRDPLDESSKLSEVEEMLRRLGPQHELEKDEPPTPQYLLDEVDQLTLPPGQKLSGYPLDMPKKFDDIRSKLQQIVSSLGQIGVDLKHLIEKKTKVTYDFNQRNITLLIIAGIVLMLSSLSAFKLYLDYQVYLEKIRRSRQ